MTMTEDVFGDTEIQPSVSLLSTHGKLSNTENWIKMIINVTSNYIFLKADNHLDNILFYATNILQMETQCLN